MVMLMVILLRWVVKGQGMSDKSSAQSASLDAKGIANYVLTLRAMNGVFTCECITIWSKVMVDSVVC